MAAQQCWDGLASSCAAAGALGVLQEHCPVPLAHARIVVPRCLCLKFTEAQLCCYASSVNKPDIEVHVRFVRFPTHPSARIESDYDRSELGLFRTWSGTRVSGPRQNDIYIESGRASECT